MLIVYKGRFIVINEDGTWNDATTEDAKLHVDAIMSEVNDGAFIKNMEL